MCIQFDSIPPPSFPNGIPSVPQVHETINSPENKQLSRHARPVGIAFSLSLDEQGQLKECCMMCRNTFS